MAGQPFQLLRCIQAALANQLQTTKNNGGNSGMIRILKLLVVGAAPFLLAAAETGSPLRGAEDAVVAEVGGVRLTLGTLEQQRPNALFQAENNYVEAEKKVVEELIDDYLLSQQAKKEG